MTINTNSSISEEIKDILKFLVEDTKKFREENIKFRENFGGVTNNLGKEVENDLEENFYKKLKNKNLKFGEYNFDTMRRNITIPRVMELDFILLNSVAIAIVEVKRNLHVKNIQKFFDITIPNFKKNFKEYNNKRIISILACKNIQDPDLVKDELEDRKQNAEIYLLSEISNSKYKKDTYITP